MEYIKKNIIYLFYGCLLGTVIVNIRQGIQINSQTERINELIEISEFLVKGQLILFETKEKENEQ